MNLLAKYKLRKYHQRLREAEKALEALNTKRKPQEAKQAIIEKGPLIKTKEAELKLGKKKVVREYSFVNKNANLVLLLIILVLLAAISASSIFYNLEFTKIKKELSNSIDEANKIANELKLNKQSLANLQQNLEVKKEREEGISQQYTDIKSQKEKIEKQINTLTLENNKLLSDIQNKNEQINKLNEKIEDYKRLTGQ